MFGINTLKIENKFYKKENDTLKEKLRTEKSILIKLLEDMKKYQLNNVICKSTIKTLQEENNSLKSELKRNNESYNEKFY